MKQIQETCQDGISTLQVPVSSNGQRSIGYARVSTEEQDPQLQVAALKAAGCKPIFIDRLSGTARSRPGLDRALARLERGDRITVWKLDRLGRSLSDLLQLLESFRSKGVEFRSLTEAIDTNTPLGQLFYSISGAFAQYELDLIRERIRDGFKTKKANGKKFGPARRLSMDAVTTARAAIDQGEPIGTVASGLSVSRQTLWRALRRQHEIELARKHQLYRIRKQTSKAEAGLRDRQQTEQKDAQSAI
jgi:DNA invertase Pin-like site-specific DNA recombinase